MQVTLLVKNLDGLKASLKAKTARQKQRIVEATAVSGQEVLETAQGLAEVDSGFYREHIRLEIGGNGDRFQVGVRAEDFIGHTNPKGVTITFFYPLVLVKGGRHRIGNDIFTAALHLRRAQIIGRYREALRA